MFPSADRMALDNLAVQTHTNFRYPRLERGGRYELPAHRS